jgi:hypothetical protein
MQGYLLEKSRKRAHVAVELGAVGQSGEGATQVRLSVTVKVPFAGESGKTGEDGEGYDLAIGEGGIGSGAPNLS